MFKWMKNVDAAGINKNKTKSGRVQILVHSTVDLSDQEKLSVNFLTSYNQGSHYVFSLNFCSKGCLFPVCPVRNRHDSHSS